jgi:hypothetical protein
VHEAVTEGSDLKGQVALLDLERVVGREEEDEAQGQPRKARDWGKAR